MKKNILIGHFFFNQLYWGITDPQKTAYIRCVQFDEFGCMQTPLILSLAVKLIAKSNTSQSSLGYIFFPCVHFFPCVLLFWVVSTFMYFILLTFFLSLSIYLRESMSGMGGGERERLRIPSRLRAVGAQPYAGLCFMNGEIMTWTEIKSWRLNRRSHPAAPAVTTFKMKSTPLTNFGAHNTAVFTTGTMWHCKSLELLHPA